MLNGPHCLAESMTIIAESRVTAYMENSEQRLPDHSTFLFALWRYDNNHDYDHPLHWSCRFALSVIFEFDTARQRKSAWALIRNAEIGCFGWKTPSGYCVASAMKKLKIEPKIFGENILPYDNRADLVQKFNLPTAKYGRRNHLSREEIEEAKKLDSFLTHLSS